MALKGSPNEPCSSSEAAEVVAGVEEDLPFCLVFCLLGFLAVVFFLASVEGGGVFLIGVGVGVRVWDSPLVPAAAVSQMLGSSSPWLESSSESSPSCSQ